MKKKNLLFLILSIFMFTNLILIDNVSAAYDDNTKYSCKYSSSSGNKAGFKLTMALPTVYSSKHGDVKRFTNWSGYIDNTTVNGLQYFYASDCPEYLIYYEIEKAFWAHDSYFAVSNETERTQMIAQIEKEDGKNIEIYSLKEKNIDIESKPVTEDHPCIMLTTKDACNNPSDNYSCIWVSTKENKNGGYCNVDNLQYVACADTYDIPNQVPELIKFLINLLEIAVPIILVIVGSITLLKAIASTNDDAIKKAKTSLIKKLIAAALVFLIVVIVKFVISIVADSSETDSISKCLDCFLSGKCDDKYYKSVANNENICKRVSDGAIISCGDE